LLTGRTAVAPPTVPADRLVRLLAAAREVPAPLDPAREAAALAAFRAASAARAREAPGARPWGVPGVPGVPGPWGRLGAALAALRAAFAVRRPRVMAAAVVSALALGGVAVGVAAATRSFPPGEGAGTVPMGPRPPAAASPDGSTAGPWTAGPATRPAGPPPHTGADPGSYGPGSGHHTQGCGKAAAHCPYGHAAGEDRKSPKRVKSAEDAKDGGAGAGAGEGEGHPRHTRPGHSFPSRSPGR
jgi:hypothetical protein